MWVEVLGVPVYQPVLGGPAMILELRAELRAFLSLYENKEIFSDLWLPVQWLCERVKKNFKKLNKFT